MKLIKAGAANISYSPWVHEIIQNGSDNEITVQIFGETTWVNGGGEALPGAEAKYNLKRVSASASANIFKDRQFDPAEAEEVVPYGCQLWNPEFPNPEDGGEPADDCDDCDDCDGDGTKECRGFCGTAYRYTVVDSCPPKDDEMMYWMETSPAYNVVYGGEEGLGFTTATFSGDPECAFRKSDAGCGIVGTGADTARGGWMQIVSVLLGV